MIFMQVLMFRQMELIQNHVGDCLKEKTEVQMFLLDYIVQAGLTSVQKQKNNMKRMKVICGLMQRQIHPRVLNRKAVV